MLKHVMYLFKQFAWTKRLTAKVIYENLAKRVQEADWHFMNYGYVPNEHEQPLELPADPSLQKYSLQMYHYLATKVDIKGKAVLEVGSGRGGGAKHIASFLEPASYVGMDIAQNAVDLANKLHGRPNLRFIQGMAEEIPLPDKSVDVVVNVESCHAYGCVDSFLREVKRVLKPGGHLLLVDFRDVEPMQKLKSQLIATGMHIVEEEDISQNVIRAIEAEDESKKERIQRLIPAKWQKQFSEFAGVVGSRLHTRLKTGERVYYRFVLQNN